MGKLLSISLITGLALAFSGIATAQLFNPEDAGTQEWSYTEHTDDVLGVAADNDGNVYSVSDDEELHKIDSDGNKLWKYTEHSDTLLDVAVDNDGNVYSAGRDNEVHKVDSDGNNVWTYTGHTNWVTSVAADNDGNVYSGSHDEEVHKVDSDGTQEWTLTQSAVVGAVAVGNDGNVYSGNRDDEVHKLTTTGSKVWKYTEHEANVRTVAADNDGNVYSGSADDELHKIDSDGNNLWRYKEHEFTVESVAVDNDGNVYSGSSDSEVHKINSGGTQEWKYTGHTESVETVTVDNDGNVYSGGSDNNVHKLTFFTFPESDKVNQDVLDLATGDFALASSAGVFTGLKVSGGITGTLAAWKLGIRDWIFGSNDADEELWKDDIRANAVTLEDNRDNVLSSAELSNDALFGDAMAEGRAQAVQELNNESTESEAKDAVQATIEDYYSDVERVIVNAYNNEVFRIEQDDANADNIGIKFGSVFETDFEDVAIVSDSYTLPNGEELETYEVVKDNGDKVMTLDDGSGVGLVTESSEEHNGAVYADGNAHYNLIQDVRDTRSNAITNVNEIVENIYENNEAGDLDVSEELSALELVNALSTDYSETGSYDFAAALLARTGQPTDLDSAFKIDYQSEELEGALFASDAVVSESVEVGQTYNGADGNAVFVAQQETEAELIELEEEFTVTSITSLDDGSELDNTTLQESDVYNQEVTDIQNELNELQDSFEEATSGFTGGFFGSSGNLYLVLAIVALAAGAFLA